MGYKDYLKEATKKLDIVDIHAFNFSNLYSEFNRKYFKNELPMLPILLGKLKKIGGLTRYTWYTNSREIQIKEIVISTFLETTKERLYGIMMHEMIHVWVLFILKDRQEHHGRQFKLKMEQLQKKVSFKIPLTDDTVGLEVSKNIKTKTLYTILRTYENKLRGYKYSVMSFNKSLTVTEISKLKTRYGWPPDQKLELYISKERQLLQYQIKRKLTNNLSFSFISDELGDLVKKTGKYVDSIWPREEVDKELTQVKKYTLLKQSLNTNTYSIIVFDKKPRYVDLDVLEDQYKNEKNISVDYYFAPYFDKLKTPTTKTITSNMKFKKIDKNLANIISNGTFIMSLK